VSSEEYAGGTVRTNRQAPWSDNRQKQRSFFERQFQPDESPHASAE
jgi:hypothetical protein